MKIISLSFSEMTVKNIIIRLEKMKLKWKRKKSKAFMGFKNADPYIWFLIFQMRLSKQNNIFVLVLHVLLEILLIVYVIQEHKYFLETH